MSKLRVMITGCAGFIGSHVTEEFLNAGYDVSSDFTNSILEMLTNEAQSL